MNSKKANIILAVLSILFALWFLLSAGNLPAPLNEVNIGPAAFPKVISILIILFSLAITIKSFLDKKSDDEIKINRFKSILMFIGGILLFGLTIPYLGFYISAAIYFPILLFLASERNWKRIVLVTVVFELFAFGVFGNLLGVPLP
ncbi:tripartite tricarboxylate transporter TctB family protein [Halobacillus litoralis]|uniref:tripartite tricarboxylate transporter TctB family protein n=1 Tax=Halobacillus litoralis TaxID=45668 RepID=UPI00249322C2|nr:tripartite tricarboxylate transporter TctB family protein [Halobacillus litoralis]